MNTEYFIGTDKIIIEDKNYVPNEFPNTWFVEEPIDVEHKHWKLMAYLQRVEQNIDKGFLFQEFETLEKRYRDLESFIASYEIINKDKKSEKLFNYIYELPGTSLELAEIDEIATRSVLQLKKKYLEIKSTITFLKNNISVVRKRILDKRKKLHVYIEMCNCSIIEHYTISKNGKVKYNGSFYSETPFVYDEENNVIEIKTSIALNPLGIILPYLIKFNLVKN